MALRGVVTGVCCEGCSVRGVALACSMWGVALWGVVTGVCCEGFCVRGVALRGVVIEVCCEGFCVRGVALACSLRCEGCASVV